MWCATKFFPNRGVREEFSKPPDEVAVCVCVFCGVDLCKNCGCVCKASKSLDPGRDLARWDDFGKARSEVFDPFIRPILRVVFFRVQEGHDDIDVLRECGALSDDGIAFLIVLANSAKDVCGDGDCAIDFFGCISDVLGERVKDCCFGLVFGAGKNGVCNVCGVGVADEVQVYFVDAAKGELSNKFKKVVLVVWATQVNPGCLDGFIGECSSIFRVLSKRESYADAGAVGIGNCFFKRVLQKRPAEVCTDLLCKSAFCCKSQGSVFKLGIDEKSVKMCACKRVKDLCAGRIIVDLKISCISSCCGNDGWGNDKNKEQCKECAVHWTQPPKIWTLRSANWNRRGISPRKVGSASTISRAYCCLFLVGTR